MPSGCASSTTTTILAVANAFRAAGSALNAGPPPGACTNASWPTLTSDRFVLGAAAHTWARWFSSTTAPSASTRCRSHRWCRPGAIRAVPETPAGAIGIAVGPAGGFCEREPLACRVPISAARRAVRVLFELAINALGFVADRRYAQLRPHPRNAVRHREEQVADVVVVGEVPGDVLVDLEPIEAKQDGGAACPVEIRGIAVPAVRGEGRAHCLVAVAIRRPIAHRVHATGRVWDRGVCGLLLLLPCFRLTAGRSRVSGRS